MDYSIQGSPTNEKCSHPSSNNVFAEKHLEGGFEERIWTLMSDDVPITCCHITDPSQT